MGWFLPGGGVIEDETPEATLRREMDEETGYSIAALSEVGSARQFIGAGVNKVETFFIVELEGTGVTQAEPDHRPRWVDLEDAVHGLKEEAQAWAVNAVRDRTR